MEKTQAHAESESEFNSLLQFFKVLGNSSRLKIVGLLANEERSVGELADLLDVKEPTVSHHLALMKRLGLVRVRAAGNVRYYRLDTRFLEGMNRDLFSQSNLAGLVEAPKTPEERVLRNYVREGRIREIPFKYKKRRLVLAWLVEHFEMGVRYPEREFSAMLQAYHPDYASLRRYLVDYGFMTREHGIYWRIEAEDVE